MATCHNCRRRRLKCDRSFPQCFKCIGSGQECLGYDRVFRWQQVVTSRDKKTKTTSKDVENDRARYETQEQQLSCPEGLSSRQFPHGNAIVSPSSTLTDPLIQHLSSRSRTYLSYFASDVCKDLVLYDIPKHNPFRELIPLTYQHPVLLQIIVANSALHMSNASQSFAKSDSMGFSFRRDIGGCLGAPSSASSTIPYLYYYMDALVAKQHALYLLRSALANPDSVDIDVTLAVVLLFVEFELIDTGQNDWRHHIAGARKIVEKLCKSTISTPTAMSPLRSYLIWNCMVYDIIGSTLTSSMDLGRYGTFPIGAKSLLQDAVGNHCSSFPTALLQLIQTGAYLFQAKDTERSIDPGHGSELQQALLLLDTAQSFDPLSWATDLQQHSPTTDLVLRNHIGSAHQAAACIYLSRVVLSLHPDAHLPNDLTSLVETVVTHLSFICPRDAIFTATMWPTFIAGAETTNPELQKWVAIRFRELWQVEPWGLIRGAMSILERMWVRKKQTMFNAKDVLRKGKTENENWLKELRAARVDWLIL